jgi:hypothetical protein
VKDMGTLILHTASNAADAIDFATSRNSINRDNLCRIAVDIKNIRIRFNNPSEVREFSTFILLNSKLKSVVVGDGLYQCTVDVSSDASSWMIFEHDQYTKVIQFEQILNSGTIQSKAPEYHII